MKKTPLPTDDRLAEISKQLYGDSLKLQIVDPKSLVLMRKNARYMPKEVFDQLTRNVKSDNALQSVPLCHTLANGKLEVLSGNHRVKAALTAGLTSILVMVIPTELANGKRRAIQLSHNAIAGQDDAQLLIELWEEIESIQDKLYSGLDSAAIGELKKINFAGFNAEQIRTEQITMWFLPEEVDKLDKLLEAFTNLSGSQRIYLAPLEKYDALFKLLMQKKKRDNIKNTAVAFMVLIDELVKYEQSKVQKKPEQQSEPQPKGGKAVETAQKGN